MLVLRKITLILLNAQTLKRLLILLSAYASLVLERSHFIGDMALGALGLTGSQALGILLVSLNFLVQLLNIDCGSFCRLS